MLWRRKWQPTPVFLPGESHGPQPTRLPRPWDSPGKNTGVGCHFPRDPVLQINLGQMAAISLALSEKEWKHKRNTTLFCIYSPAARQVASVVSDSVRPHERQPTRLLRPWDSPGKNTGVGCHFLLQCMKVESESEVDQSCWTLSDPMDCSLPGSSIHGIFWATELEWGAIAFSQFNYILWLFKNIYDICHWWYGGEYSYLPKHLWQL